MYMYMYMYIQPHSQATAGRPGMHPSYSTCKFMLCYHFVQVIKSANSCTCITNGKFQVSITLSCVHINMVPNYSRHIEHTCYT